MTLLLVFLYLISQQFSTAQTPCTNPLLLCSLARLVPQTLLTVGTLPRELRALLLSFPTAVSVLLVITALMVV